MKLKLCISALFSLICCLQLLATNGCSNPDEGVFVKFNSFTLTNTGNNTNLNFYIVAKDTQYLNNTYSFTLTGFFSGTKIVSINKQLYPNDTIQVSITGTYDTLDKPIIPKDFVLNVSIDSVYVMQSVGLVYYTPTHQMKVETWEDFENLGIKWPVGLTSFNSNQLMSVNIPNSDISDSTIINDSIDLIYRFYDSLPYSIALMVSDTFNYDPDSTGIYRADGCGLGRKEFRANISNFRIFNWYETDASVVRQLYLPNANVKICVNRTPGQVIKTVKTDWDGFLVDENGNRNFNLNFCAGSGRNQVDIFLIIELKDPDNANKLRVKKSGSTNRTADFITQVQTLFYDNGNRTNISSFWTATQNGSNFEMSLNGADATSRI